MYSYKFADKDRKLSEASYEQVYQMDENLSKQVEGLLLPGELVVGHAKNVTNYILPELTSTKGTSGLLVCTNFRLMFITKSPPYCNLVAVKNKLLGPQDITLSNIETIYIEKQNGKKKKLFASYAVKDGIQAVDIHCKDFRIVRYNFKFSILGEGKNIVRALLYHSYPKKSSLSFALEYNEKLKKLHSPQQLDEMNTTDIRMFRNEQDLNELINEHKMNGRWRVCNINNTFRYSAAMPGYFIVPVSLSDYQLKEAVHQYNNDRLPIWSYTHTNKCSIIRCTPFREEAVQFKIDATIKNAINKTSPYGKPSKTFDLSELCPSINQVEQSFKKFKNLNMSNGTSKEFDDSDNKYLSEVQSSKYYQHISTCLQVANNCVEHINNNRSNLLLQETNGVDFTCLISSLTQIMLDPTKRTVKGVSEIIQREWIVNCHPFSTRLGTLDQPVKQNTFNKFGSVNSYYTANSIMQAANQHHMNGKSPVFTLFLDCLYQILTQQPSKVEYSSFFLTSLLDGLYVPVFDSFVFNHERDRFTNLQRTQSQLQDTENSQTNDDNQTANNHVIITGFVKQRHRVVETLPIWCWKHQYDCDVINMFKNALYKWDEKISKHNLPPNNQQLTSNNDDVTNNDVTVKQVDTSSQKQGRSTFYVNNKNGGKNNSCREYRPIKCGSSEVIKMHDNIFDVEDDDSPNNDDVIKLMTQQSQLKIWGEAYYRWNPHLQGCDCGNLPVLRRTSEIMNEISKLEDKITNLELVLRGDLNQLPLDDDVENNNIITSQSLSRYDVTSAYFPYIAQTLTRLKKSRKIGRVASIIHSKHRKRDSITTSNHHNNQIVLTTAPPTDNNSTKRNTTYLSAV